MVHSRVNKWSRIWLKFLKAHVDHSLTQHFCFKSVIEFFFGPKNVLRPVFGDCFVVFLFFEG